MQSLSGFQEREGCGRDKGESMHLQHIDAHRCTCKRHIHIYFYARWKHITGVQLGESEKKRTEMYEEEGEVEVEVEVEEEEEEEEEEEKE